VELLWVALHYEMEALARVYTSFLEQVSFNPVFLGCFCSLHYEMEALARVYTSFLEQVSFNPVFLGCF
jgi:hypothetical protein